MRKVVVNVNDKDYLKIKNISDLMGITTGQLMSQIIMTNEFSKSLDTMYIFMLESLKASENKESDPK